MNRFPNGLNPQITDKIERHHYVDLNDMVHTSIKVNKKLKWSNFEFRPSPQTKSTSPWKVETSLVTVKVKLKDKANVTIEALK